MNEQVVLVTGGTQGIGRAIGLAFARAGASVWLTYRWGTADLTALCAQYAAEGLAAPRLVECDAGDPAANRQLMAQIRDAHGRLDVVVSNVAFTRPVLGIEDLSKRALDLSLAYSAWPMVDLLQASHAVLGTYPRYLLGTSSDGVDRIYPDYDLVGVCKAVMETLCRYLAIRLRPLGTRVNVVRSGLVDTASGRAVLGDAAMDDMVAHGMAMAPDGAGSACVALCSGLMDAVTGQVITVDDGIGMLTFAALSAGIGLAIHPDGAPSALPASGTTVAA